MKDILNNIKVSSISEYMQNSELQKKDKQLYKTQKFLYNKNIF